MIKSAKRLELFNEYYFSGKLRELSLRKEKGEDIINLGIGSPDLPPMDEAIKTLQQEVKRIDTHSYQSYNGIPELRKSISDWYRSIYKVVLDPNTEILPLMGSKEGIMHISLAFLNPGDGVLIPNPSYPTYQSVTNIVGAEIKQYDLLPENNWEPDFNALEQLKLDTVKMMWVNYPNMPTGKAADLLLFKKLIDFGKKHNILICNDNPYSLILHEQALSIMQVEGARDIAIELNSLSKSHNMAGWRIGMLCSNAEFIKSILTVKSNMDSGMFKPLQLAASKALLCSSEWYASLNTEYNERRKIVFNILDSLNCDYDPKQGGMFVWARIPDKFNSSTEYADFLLNKVQVFISPGSIFGSNGDPFIRISLCSSMNVLNEVKNRIKQLAKKRNEND